MFKHKILQVKQLNFYFQIGILVALLFAMPVFSQDFAEPRKCLRCHGNLFYQYQNDVAGRLEKRPMNPHYFIDSTRVFQSIHNGFACTDCHSADYEQFPHAGELRNEEIYQCIDCHGGDEAYAKFNFEGIEAEFQKSVHFKMNEAGFNCWMCHDPHGYKPALRESSSIKEVVAMSNKMCLDCHTNNSEYGQLTDSLPADLLKSHAWLPNQQLHFDFVRCLDCHTKVSSDLLVSHNIMPKDSALRNCVSCHSQNSILMESLYSQQVQESRAKKGFVNATFLNESYIIGANRNIYLNAITIGIFILVILGICIHGVLRIVLKKEK